MVRASETDLINRVNGNITAIIPDLVASSSTHLSVNNLQYKGHVYIYLNYR